MGFKVDFFVFLKLCSKGLVHVMKYLCKEADRDERKRGIMQNDGSFRRNRLKRSSSFSASLVPMKYPFIFFCL